MAWVWLSKCLLLLSVNWCAGASVEVSPGMEDRDWEWGSGLQELLHSFPADSPFVTETPEHPANCTQRFWLPPSSPVCWDDIAGPEEFEKTRLLVLQNRAALQAVSQASGLEDGGASYDQQAREDIQGVQADHVNIEQTADSMQKVFVSLDEKRKEGGQHYTFSSLKEQIADTVDSINGRDEIAALLEQRLSNLERSLDTMQHRLARLLAQ
ncbi:uncharacterized protein [Salminus brasiliensis]|uniref:uncharacterized protein n=1 Tax=Salminus brasiliensis TaxID=930266 RepID=UPI003B835FF7